MFSMPHSDTSPRSDTLYIYAPPYSLLMVVVIGASNTIESPLKPTIVLSQVMSMSVGFQPV